MSQEDNRKNLNKGIGEFLSHYPPFLRHLVFPGICSLIMAAFIILLAIVGSCVNFAGTCAYVGKRLVHKDTECIIERKSASGYLGTAGECCYWNVSVEREFMEMRFDTGEGTSDSVVVIMSEDGGEVMAEYVLGESKNVFLSGPAEYRVVVFAESGHGSWSAEWD